MLAKKRKTSELSETMPSDLEIYEPMTILQVKGEHTVIVTITDKVLWRENGGIHGTTAPE